MRVCIIRVYRNLNDFSHTSQTYGRYSDWMRTCFFDTFFSTNALLHTSHIKVCSPLCIPSCLSTVFWTLKVSLHNTDGSESSISCRSCRSFKVCWKSEQGEIFKINTLNLLETVIYTTKIIVITQKHFLMFFRNL